MTQHVSADQVIPRYAMLDLWMALRGDALEFEAWRDSCTYDEAWAQLLDWVRRRPKPEPVTDQTVEAAARVIYENGASMAWHEPWRTIIGPVHPDVRP